MLKVASRGRGGEVHEKSDLPKAFYERRTREFGGESEGPRALLQKKMNLGLAEVQFPAVLRGLLALFSLFLVDILSRSQFLTPTLLYLYANLDELRDPYFQKVGVRTPRLSWLSQCPVVAVQVAAESKDQSSQLEMPLTIRHIAVG